RHPKSTLFPYTTLFRSSNMTPKTIAEEIKQSKPFGSLQQEVYLSLQRTADELHSRVVAVLKPFGVSSAQYNVLRILRGAGTEGRSEEHTSELQSRSDLV